jgi:hypothetical protein
LKSKRRGFFLVLILLLTIVVLMMVGVTLQMSRQSQYSSTYHTRQIAALAAAEGGVTDVKSQFLADRTWGPTSSYSVTLPGQRSSYRTQFAATPVVDPDLSINNLSGETAVDGPRGVGTVPPRSAYLVIDGFSGEARQRLEVIVKASPFSSLQSPLVTSGAQYFDEDVHVTGILDFDDITPATSDIHSNSDDVTSTRIEWAGTPGELFKVDGTVSATADSSSAFDLSSGGGTVDIQSSEFGSGSRQFPELNIEEIVDTASGTSVSSPPSGTSLTLSSDSVSNGQLNIQGDLILDGAHLFVDGDLIVNGSITGEGSVFVLGDTRFSGASSVNVTEGHVSLYSEGHVVLNGFGGTEYLESVAPIQEPLERVKFALHGISQEMTQFRYDGGVSDWRARGWVDIYRPLLGQAPGNHMPIGFFAGYPDFQNDAAAWGLPPVENIHANSVQTCIDHLQTLVPSANSQNDRRVNFLLTKLVRLQLILDANDYPGTIAGPLDIVKVDDYLADGTVSEGLLDTIMDDLTQYNRAGEIMEGEMRNFTFDSVGSSYFKGVIYSNGAVHCTNEVEVLGGIYVEKNRFSPAPTDKLTTPDRDLEAGDVQFDSGTKITYVEGLLEQSPAAGGNNLVTTVYWSIPPTP